MAYVGDGWYSEALRTRLVEQGCGQMIARGRIDRIRSGIPWAYDNGAYTDWAKGRAFDGLAFLDDLETICDADPAPDFVVLPDRVASGDSLAFSLAWLRTTWATGLDCWPLYLAVQDGMTAADIPWDMVDGIFIGGSLDWKVATAATWRHESAAHGLPCHYARCGTKRRVAHAAALGMDSIDSALPLWSRGNLRVFLDALNQGTLSCVTS
jgi:hypothetical protein